MTNAALEQKRIEDTSSWYINSQLGFDHVLLGLRYRTLKPHIVGKHGLELGTAEGVMTAMLLNDFDTLSVVDASAELLALIPENSKLTKHHSLFEQFQPAQKFDTIILEHVLEHVEDPVGLLKLAKTWLAPQGVICAGVPNGHSIHRLAAVKMGLLPEPCALNARDHALGHRRVYTPQSFQADIKAAGLSIELTKGVFFKPLSNQQIEQHWTVEMIEGFYQLGLDFPDHAAEIFCLCKV